MKKVLLICSLGRGQRELTLPHISEGYELVFDDYSSESLEEFINEQPKYGHKPTAMHEILEGIKKKYTGQHFDGITSCSDYPGSILASIIAHERGLPGPHPAQVLECSHKYYSRCAQQKYVPEAVPQFMLIEDDVNHAELAKFTFPCFIKPVKSYFSINAYKVENEYDVQRICKEIRFSKDFIAPMNYFLKQYTDYPKGAECLLLESYLSGSQVTIEGYMFQGNAYILGVVDSVMFPGTISFARFEYPSSLPESVQKRMHLLAKKVMEGIGFDNALFNIELMYNPDTDQIHIIEINPRMVSQFADLYERVDGTNAFRILIEVATGTKPKVNHRQGQFSIAASCVLRTFQNQFVKKVPSAMDLAKVKMVFPDVRVEIIATEGKTLAHELQDGKSYRYGLINLGGKDINDLLARFEICKNYLNFVLEPI